MLGEVLKSIGSGGPVSLPCQLYEPLSVLQRSVEMFEYRGCLDKVRNSVRLEYAFWSAHESLSSDLGL